MVSLCVNAEDKAYVVKPLIHQSELRTYTKVVPFHEKNSFHFVVL
jgi:RecG-like helicase